MGCFNRPPESECQQCCMHALQAGRRRRSRATPSIRQIVIGIIANERRRSGRLVQQLFGLLTRVGAALKSVCFLPLVAIP